MVGRAIVSTLTICCPNTTIRTNTHTSVGGLSVGRGTFLMEDLQSLVEIFLRRERSRDFEYRSKGDAYMPLFCMRFYLTWTFWNLWGRLEMFSPSLFFLSNNQLFVCVSVRACLCLFLCVCVCVYRTFVQASNMLSLSKITLGMFGRKWFLKRSCGKTPMQYLLFVLILASLLTFHF